MALVPVTANSFVTNPHTGHWDWRGVLPQRAMTPGMSMNARIIKSALMSAL